MPPKKAKAPQSMRISAETVNRIKELHIEMGGVELDTYESKLKHLLWFYEHYKNDNGKPKM